MSTAIYYFSGTGNSLTAARYIAEKLDGKLIPIPAVMKEKNVKLEADVVGVVFPAFYATNDCGVPPIIERFINKLENFDLKYIFAVCTHGGMPGTTIANLRKAIKARGGKLAAGFVVKMSNKNVAEAKRQKMLVKQKKKLEAICEYVNTRREGKFETRGLLRKILLAPLRLLEKPIFLHRYRRLSGTSSWSFSELIPLADRSFRTNENCIGCGTCVRVCPVNNIKLVDGKPVWQHHCETCYSCYTWCPKNAIYGDIVSYNDWYHNPEVKVSDMLSRSSS